MTHLSSSPSQRPSQVSIDNGSTAHRSRTHDPAFTPSLNQSELSDHSHPNPYTPTEVPKDWQYESAVKTVESIIKNIESGNMELAAIFDQFAIAIEHLQSCETFLKHHRQQVDLLVETLTDEANF